MIGVQTRLRYTQVEDAIDLGLYFLVGYFMQRTGGCWNDLKSYEQTRRAVVMI